MKTELTFVALLMLFFPGQMVVPDFGADGLAGLSAEEQRKLIAEEIVVPEEPMMTEGGKTMVTAALLIHKPVGKVWEVLSSPEIQAEYLPEVKKAQLISREGGEDRVRFEVKIWGTTVRYTVIHRFYPEINALTWTLDPASPNDLEEFQGFWRLYPWAEDKTLARYGSLVAPRFGLAKWVIQMLYRRRVRQSLLSVKTYVESLAFPLDIHGLGAL